MKRIGWLVALAIATFGGSSAMAQVGPLQHASDVTLSINYKLGTLPNVPWKLLGQVYAYSEADFIPGLPSGWKSGTKLAGNPITHKYTSGGVSLISRSPGDFSVPYRSEAKATALLTGSAYESAGRLFMKVKSHVEAVNSFGQSKGQSYAEALTRDPIPFGGAGLKLPADGLLDMAMVIPASLNSIGGVGTLFSIPFDQAVRYEVFILPFATFDADTFFDTPPQLLYRLSYGVKNGLPYAEFTQGTPVGFSVAFAQTKAQIEEQMMEALTEGWYEDCVMNCQLNVIGNEAFTIGMKASIKVGN
jgi:hypothetical protein